MAAMIIVEREVRTTTIRCAQCAQRDPTVWVVRTLDDAALAEAIDRAVEHGRNAHGNGPGSRENRETRIELDR